ncbi:DUF222 domain-containing protein [Terrabacter sp. Ter38]|uniref:DUF222 domain-containing protein n=1 Tax=Terrabacter sp. Ter38 TaxID=2926030 RepID=UPI0021193F86|nr:DUF222 domain-containing protein [Terrabacter sp. Ter38]
MEQSRSTQQIEQDWDHVASLAADLHDAHARFVDLVVAVLADGSWQAAGLRSPEHWLMLRAGLSRGQAGAMVLLARRAAELPATVAALREGRISLDQAAVVARHTPAAVVARHTPAAFDTTVAQFAQHATVTQLQRTVTRYDFTLQPDSVDDRGRALPGEATISDVGPVRAEPVEPAHLSMGLDADGRFRLRYDAPAEVGALVESALAEAKDHLFHTLSTMGPPRESSPTGSCSTATCCTRAGPRSTAAGPASPGPTPSSCSPPAPSTPPQAAPTVRAVPVVQPGGPGTGCRSTSTPTAAGSPAAPACPNTSRTS